MQLVLFVEKTFKIQLEGEDLNMNNLNSINALAELVNRKLEKTD